MSSKSDRMYAFHTTSPENVAEIRESGIQSQTELASDSSDILEVLSELGYSDPFPFDRRTATYCHIDERYVTQMLRAQEKSPFDNQEQVVRVDVTGIDCPMYLADMSVITDLIDYRYAGASGMFHTETPHEAVKLYQDSIKPVQSPRDISAYEGHPDGHTELVVDGCIPPSAIVDVMTGG